MLNKIEFVKKIERMPKTIFSKTKKASYTKFAINGDELSFFRIVPKSEWKLSLQELYEVYKQNSFINTSVIKRQTGGRVNSPMLAILLAIKCVDPKGNRIDH